MQQKRDINLSSLAFIDVMACGLGAVILLFFILDFQEPANVQEKLMPIAEGKTEDERLKEKSEYQELKNERERLLFQKSEKVESIEYIADELSEKMIESLRIETSPRPAEENSRKSAEISNSKENYPGQLIGLSVDGAKILLVLDTSASMAHDKLVDIIVGLVDHSGQHLSKGAKWRQAKRIGAWIIENAPSSSKVRLLSYSDKVT